MNSQEILNFWFKELEVKDWFTKNDEVDLIIQNRFMDIYLQAKAGELFRWRETAEGRLAEIIVLDQFPRNIFRNSADAFATDSLALILAQEMVALKLDLELEAFKRAFAYLPYMHSESKLIHQEALKLFSQEDLEENYKFEIAHKKVIDQFGRYPHRNEVLNRKSTPGEIDYLKDNKGW